VIKNTDWREAGLIRLNKSELRFRLEVSRTIANEFQQQSQGRQKWRIKGDGNLRWRQIPTEEVIVPEPYFEPMPVTGQALTNEEARVKSMLEAKVRAPK